MGYWLKAHLGSMNIIIIPWAQVGSESIAHEGKRNNCFSKIQLVGQKYRDKATLARKMWFDQPSLFWFSKPALFTTSGL